MGTASLVEIRRATTADDAQILGLLPTSLPWADDDRYPPFVAWKHRHNAFGPSAEWVATAEGRIVGYRSFMRWDFTSSDEAVVRTVRAVDTVTHPDYRGRGIFSDLTMAALEGLREEGVAFVFNMPNRQSGPGYLKMGWQTVPHPTVCVRPRLNPRSFVRSVLASGPSERWSLSSSAGVAAPEFLAMPGLDDLLGSQPAPTDLRTRLTPEYLRWRYGLASLAYRCLPAGHGPADGFAVFRMHQRGDAVELVLCEALVPEGDKRLITRLLRTLTAVSPWDHAITITQPGLIAAGFFPTTRKTTLMWRAVCHSEPPKWTLTMGDLEIF